MHEQTASETAALEIERFKDVMKEARMVCHEMKQPLMISMNSLELMMFEALRRSESTDRLQKIHSQTHRLSELTNKLMRLIPKLE